MKKLSFVAFVFVVPSLLMGQCINFITGLPTPCNGSGSGTVTSVTCGTWMTGGTFTTTGTCGVDTSQINTHVVRTDVNSALTGGTQFDASLGTLILPEAAGALPTLIGFCQYDTTNLLLKCGDGSATRTVVTTDNTQTLSNKTFVAPVLGTPASGVGTNITGIQNANVSAAPVPAPGTTITLAAPRGYAICTGTCTVTVPVPAAGYEFCILNDDNVATAITLAALGSSAMYENSARTAYGTAGTGTLVVAASAANKVCILGRDSTHYFTVSNNGGAITVN